MNVFIALKASHFWFLYRRGVLEYKRYLVDIYLLEKKSRIIHLNSEPPYSVSGILNK